MGGGRAPHPPLGVQVKRRRCVARWEVAWYLSVRAYVALWWKETVFEYGIWNGCFQYTSWLHTWLLNVVMIPMPAQFI